MKKKVVLMLIVTALMCISIIPMFTACSANREDTLKILTIDEYLNEGLIAEFQEYYKSVTGKDIEVDVQYTPTNEEMYAKISLSKADFDIICPSDYMVEKMARQELLLSLAKDFGTDVDGKEVVDNRKNVSAYLTGDTFSSVPGDYACAYMWGTLGIVYNRSNISTATLKSEGWNALWSTSYGKIQMKDSVRDTMAAGAVYTFKTALDNGASLNDVINYTDSEHLNQIKTNLITQKKLSSFYGYETDNGKTDILEGKSSLLLQWSGDAVYTLSDDIKDVVPLDSYPDLAYYVPKYSNVWCDYWAIPKYAGNTTAANLWINFMCSDKAAIDSMDYIGYTSAIATDATFEYANAAITYAEDDEDEATAAARLIAEDEDRFMYADISYFFIGVDGAENMLIDYVQYPPKSVIQYCAVMRDFGDSSQTMQNVWTAVKNA